jgi:Amt family ammonium transporter
MQRTIALWISYIMLLCAVTTGTAYAQNTPATAPAPAAAAAAPAPRAPDPAGTSTGGAADAPAKTLDELSAIVGHNKISINFVWVLITGYLVMFMQAGFAMVETGFTRAKNVAHTMAMNFMVYPLGMIGFYICGFAFMFGGLGAIVTLGGYDGLNSMISIGKFEVLGANGFFLGGSHGAAYDAAVYTLFLFQMVFMDTTATIPTGSMAERWKYSSFFVYALGVSTIIYPVYGCWVWGGGWLADLGTMFPGLGHGHVDFAGSSVVHLTGGVLALVGAWIIGPRLGKYSSDGTVNAIPGHNIPMAIVGSFILAFGWFGFNPGSTLAGTDLRIGVVATNTMLAGSFGALAATLWMWWVRSNKPDPSMMCNGLLAGLVAITAPCAFVNSVGSMFIGLISGILVVEAAFFIDSKLKIDDPVGAVAVHGVNGAWGCLSIGLFADGSYGDGWNGVAGTVKGVFYSGEMGQFWAELIGVCVNIVYVGIVGFIMFKVIDAVIGLRVNANAEVEGLDIPEMGVIGYNDGR